MSLIIGTWKSHRWDFINSGVSALGQMQFSQFYVYFKNFMNKFKNCCLDFHVKDLI